MSPVASCARWSEARTLFRRHRVALTAALLLVVTNRLATLALPAASRYVVDEVIGRHRVDLLPFITVFACTAVAIESAAAFGAAQFAGLAGQRAIAGLRRELQSRLLGLPLSRIDDSQSGSLASRLMTDTEQVRFLLGNGSVQVLASTLTAGVALGLLAWLNLGLTLAVVAVLVLLACDLTRGINHVTAAFAQLSRRLADVTGRLAQTLGGLRMVKVCAAERHESHRFVRESHALFRDGMHAAQGLARLGAASTLASGAVGVLLLVVGSRAVVSGTMSLGSLVMFTWLTGYLLTPVLNIAAGAGELGRAVAALGRLSGLRELPTEQDEDGTRDPFRKLAGTVELVDVSYAYVPGRLVLRGVSLHAPPGSTTAIVGPSGSGKSTLCRLLLAFARPTSGRILIDGLDLTAVGRRGYRSHLGVVLQDDVLFDGTIADNIRYGRPRAGWAEVRAAGASAHCDEFVATLPEGYATVVGERGVRLSSGQRQRIAIARAMLADPRILILDEATSNLDSETELLVQAALQTLREGRTTFVVAHRLSTARIADQIVVLDAGRVVECGTHEMLMAREGRYRRLYHHQQRTGDTLDSRNGGKSPFECRPALEERRCG